MSVMLTQTCSYCLPLGSKIMKKRFEFLDLSKKEMWICYYAMSIYLIGDYS